MSEHTRPAFSGRQARFVEVIALCAFLTMSAPALAELLRIEVDVNGGVGSHTWVPGSERRSAHQIPAPGYLRDAAQVGNHCIGFIGDTPTMTVTLRTATQAQVTVESQSDPVLVMVGPGGQVFCNDDSNGLNPALFETFEAGQWDIYVGSYGSGQPFPFELILH